MQEKTVKGMVKYTDLWPWYWYSYSYGQGEYAFAVVEAYPTKDIDFDHWPAPGSQLFLNENLKLCGGNGVEMEVMQEIADIENQNGDTICQFIAESHAHFLQEYME